MTPLEEDTTDLLRRLFAAATESLQHAHEAVVEGQAAAGSAEHYRVCAALIVRNLEKI